MLTLRYPVVAAILPPPFMLGSHHLGIALANPGKVSLLVVWIVL